MHSPPLYGGSTLWKPAHLAPASRYELDGIPPEPLSGSLKTVVACHPAQLVPSLQGPSRGLPSGSRSGLRPFRAGSCRPPAPETPFPGRPEAQERPFRVFGPPPSKRAFGAPRAFLRPPGAFRGVIVIGRWGLTGTAGPPPFITDQAANGFRVGSVRNAASEPGAVRPCIDRMQSASIRRFEQNAKTL